MSLSEVLLYNAAAIAGLMLLVWLISLPLKDVSIVDLVWGLGFVLVSWVTFGISESAGPARWLLPLMTTVWGLRLSGYLAWRNSGKPEDERYAAMREKWGGAFPLISLLTVFTLQGVVMWTVSLPVQTGISQAVSGWQVLHVAGLAVWLCGLLFESVGDWQLARFKARSDSQNQVMNKGLWRYTRHPNYFGDFLVWWGLYLTAVADGTGLWTIVGPIIMSTFLMKFSGVALLEKSLRRKRPEYQQYAETTNAFFPWFPRRPANS